jgi:hypothetical protein
MKSAQEKKAEAYFHRTANALIARVGTSALYGDQVDALGKELFGRRWGGVTNQGDWRPTRNRFYVVNTSHSVRSPGYHWVGIYVTPAGVPWAYDSFGRNPQKLLYKVGKTARRVGHALQGTDPDAEQPAGTAVCGALSLAWLISVRDLGVRMAALI